MHLKRCPDLSDPFLLCSLVQLRIWQVPVSRIGPKVCHLMFPVVLLSYSKKMLR